MKPIIHGSGVRLALALGLVGGAWLIGSASTLSASATGDAAPLPGGAASAVVEPERIVLAQADAAAVESPVSYATEQADRGEKRYESDCEECHGSDLKGGLNGGPPLRGVNFEQNYADGLPASVMYSFMSSQMPPNSPGRYSPSAYADLMAYVLKRNGFRTGAPLPSDVDALNYLMMEK